MRRWPYTVPLVFSVVIGVITIVTSQVLDLPIRDPDGFIGPSYIRLPAIVLAFFAAGIIPTAIARYGWRKIPSGVARVWQTDWPWIRVLNVAGGLGTFYICYVSYRNMKSYLPVIRDNVLYDHDMIKIDHAVLFGHYPSTLLHHWLGTGISAQVLSTFYVSYLSLIPLLLGAYLVFSKDFMAGAWLATALALNWVLGAVSYYIFPTLGPAFYQPQNFEDLPHTAAQALQKSLIHARLDFLTDPWASDKIHGIAGFASLHVSVVVSFVTFFARIRSRKAIRAMSLVFLVFTVTATLYFGWHYIADDVAGAFIGWISVVAAAWMTKNPQKRPKHYIPPTTDADGIVPDPLATALHDRETESPDVDEPIVTV